MASISDAQETDFPDRPKGFRKRWLEKAAECFDETNKPCSTSDVRDGFSHLVPDLTEDCGVSASAPVNEVRSRFLSRPKNQSHSRNQVDSRWKTAAVIADAKRARFELPRMPWDQQPFNSIFGTLGNRVDDFLGSNARRFMPTSIGLDESLEGYVSQGENRFVLPAASEVVARPLILKKARVQKPDEDVRRVALQRLQTLLLSDPQATVLGESISNLFSESAPQQLIDQSISDAFRAKASSTLQKRAGSLARFGLLMNWCEGGPLRFTEEDLYQCLCMMRETNVGPTSAQHMLEALHFLDGVARFKYVNLKDVVSSRCKGAARDQFLNKRLLVQKSPLSAHLVNQLEVSIRTLKPVEICILGQLLFCVHASARWSDSLRIATLWSEESGGEILVHADAAGSKTSVSSESQRRLLPYVALGMGVSGTPWSRYWFEARKSEGWTMMTSFYQVFPKPLGNGRHPQ